MPRYYPVFLNLSGKRAVVIGGGAVTERKVATLLACGAQVTLISPELTPELERLVLEGAITARRRSYVPGDVKDAYIAVVGTDDLEVNHQAANEARQERVLVNTVDDVAYCDFIAPAIVQQGDLTLAISTNGKSPAMARRIREELEAYLTPDYADLLAVLEKVRIKLRRLQIAPGPDRWQEHIDEELRDMVRQRKLQEAEAHLLADLTRAADTERTARAESVVSEL